MNFMELAAQRYSVREYDSRPVEPEKLKQVLKAAQLAPTAKKLQPFKILVLQSEEALEKARKCTPLTYGAPVVLVFCYNSEDGFEAPINDVNFDLEDVSIVATHVMLEAAELGLGTVWVGYFKQKRIMESFGLAGNWKPALMMPLGYAKPGLEPNPLHFQTKPLDELVELL